MKTGTKKAKNITDLDFDGPMMICKPMTEKEKTELAKWVEEHKAADKLKSERKLSKAVKKL